MRRAHVLERAGGMFEGRDRGGYSREIGDGEEGILVEDVALEKSLQ